MVKRTRFESLSKYYDFFTKILMLGSYGYIRNRIVDNKSTKFSLDLCCGTGFVTRHINSDLIIGLDLTPGMLKINKKKIDDIHTTLQPGEEQVIKVGKRKFLRIIN